VEAQRQQINDAVVEKEEALKQLHEKEMTMLSL
jgi:hypothetical protein